MVSTAVRCFRFDLCSLDHPEKVTKRQRVRKPQKRPHALCLRTVCPFRLVLKPQTGMQNQKCLVVLSLCVQLVTKRFKARDHPSTTHPILFKITRKPLRSISAPIKRCPNGSCTTLPHRHRDRLYWLRPSRGKKRNLIYLC